MASKRGANLKEYFAWRDLRKRCNDPKNKRYKHYGGRGIYVCKEWDSFDNFLLDMGPAKPGESIDRIDNDGPYQASNCRWASGDMQARNRTANHFIEKGGKRMCVTDWAKVIGITPSAIWHRIRRGASEQDAVSPIARTPT